MKIIIQVGNNGIGNLLFTFAFGKVLENLYGYSSVYYDTLGLTKYVRGREMHDISEYLSMPIQKATLKEIREASGISVLRNPQKKKSLLNNDMKMQTYLKKKWKQNQKLRANIIDESVFRDSDKNIDYIKKRIEQCASEDYIYFIGYWQDMGYYAGRYDIIKNCFSFQIKSDRCRKYLTEIQRGFAVSVHIRRGDYMKKDYSMQFCVCHQNYYQKAIRYFDTLEGTPHFYFFSDDMNYVRKMYGHMENATFVEGCMDYEDIFLMSHCNANIIGNSTFSFWGAYLNTRQDAIRIAPDIQYLKKTKGAWRTVKMSVPEEWIVM